MDPLRLLAATDGSEVGEHAVRVVRSLAERDRAALDIMSVETDGLPGLTGSSGVRRGASTSATIWARGVPGVEIVRHADLHRANLVVLGRGPRSPTAPTRLGQTSDTVIRRRQGPSLFIPPEVSEIHRVVIALDGTYRGLRVLDDAARVVAMAGAEATSVTVVPSGNSADGTGGDPRVTRVRQALEAFPGLGGSAHHRVLEGDPVGEILRFLAYLKADLLVLGVRGGGPAGEMGSGHVGRDLLQSAGVAILSIPI